MRTVSSRASGLASAFRAENEALADFVETMDERDRALACLDEGRSVGVVVQHIAEGHRIIGGIVRAMAASRPLPVQAWRTVEQGAAVNAPRLAVLPAGHGRKDCACSDRTRRVWPDSSRALTRRSSAARRSASLALRSRTRSRAG